MSKTLVVGDVHIGKGQILGSPGIGFKLNGRIIDQFNLLDWILDQAIDLNVSMVIFTGDIFEDAKPDYILMINFINWIKKFNAFGIDIHIVRGNHDIKRVGEHYISCLDLLSETELPNIFFHKNINTIFNGTVGFTLLPFRDRKSFNINSATEALSLIENQIKYELTSIPSTYDKVLIGHMALEGSLRIGDEFDDEINELLCPLSIFKNYDYVWMGHIHRPQIRSKLPYIAHIGSLDLSDFGEVDHQKILILFDSDLPNKFQEIPVPSRSLRIFKLSIKLTDLENDDATSFLLFKLSEFNNKKSLENCILKVDLQLLDNITINKELVQNELYNKYNIHYLSAFLIVRTNIVVSQEKKKDIDISIDSLKAIKMWSEDQKYISIDEKESFIEMCTEIIEECK